eukprot:4529324-Amphidinium_carterae.1
MIQPASLCGFGADFPLQENELRTRTAKGMCNPQCDVETEIAIAGTIHKNSIYHSTKVKKGKTRNR